MKQFKAMGEAAKSGLFRKILDAGSEKTKDIREPSREDIRNFWERYEAAKVFVFATHTWPTPADDAVKVAATAEPDLDVPFQTCSFESLTHDGKDWLVEVSKESKGRFNCIMLHEVMPRRYDMYAYGDSGWVAFIPWEEGKGHPLAWINVIWLDFLRRGSMGVEHVREKIKIGTGAEKRFHVIRQIIRVVPRKERGLAPAAFSREVDWSHRWTVRGHWVSLAGRLGKNRAGEYCVQDWTWRSEHEKGPEDAPLIQKTRFVRSPAQHDYQETK